jgi:uncharacterized protein YjbI with pentapeptide repeats
MVNSIKSIVQQSLSFLLVLVIAFSVFSGVLFLNPSPSYAFNQSDVDRAFSGDKNLSRANLGGANLSEGDLSEADLSRANLGGANLSEADLSRADLEEASANFATIFPEDFYAEDKGVEFDR